jgi:hypothetical protein
MAIASPNMLFLCACGTIPDKFFVTAPELKSRKAKDLRRFHGRLWDSSLTSLPSYF